MSKRASTGEARLVPADAVFAAARQRPGFRAAYDALDEEFSIMSALIKARTAAGLTQDQVAARMNSTQPAIARLESGGRIPSTRTLQRYAEATGHRLRITLEPIDRKAPRKVRAAHDRT